MANKKVNPKPAVLLQINKLQTIPSALEEMTIKYEERHEEEEKKNKKENHKTWRMGSSRSGDYLFLFNINNYANEDDG